jgi:hypothetical protein
MKKISCILGIAMAMLTSCSNDEFETPDPNASRLSLNQTQYLNQKGTLLKKTVAVINGGTTEITGDYIYNGNKLVKIVSSDGKEVVYTYTGNLITERAFYTNGVLNTKELFEYNATNQLITLKRVSPNNIIQYRAVYVYNVDGTVSVTGYKGDLIAQSSVIKSRKVFFLNGQVSKIETYVTVNGSVVTNTANYTFDNKNTPFRNILGFDKLTYHDAALNGNPQNITGISYTGSSPANSDKIQYTYNAIGYPLTAAEVYPADKIGKSTVFQYFYE